MAITLPRNALIKLTGLNTYAQRNLKTVTGFSASGGYVTFYTNSTSGLVNGNTVTVSNMQGAPAQWSFTVSNVTATSFRTSSVAAISWPVSILRCYRNGNRRYLDAMLYGQTTVKPGDTATLNAGPSFPSSSMTVAMTTNSEIIFTNDAGDFAGGAQYPYYSNGVNDVIPGGAQTITLNSTSATRTPALVNVYWSIGGGASTVTLSDHSREALDATPEEISDGGRTVDGTMRKSHIASKQTFSTSWTLLPADAVATVDGFAGGKDLLDIYNNNVGAFNMELYTRDSARKGSAPDFIYRVFIKDFDYSVIKRNVLAPTGVLTDYWDVKLSLEEE